MRGGEVRAGQCVHAGAVDLDGHGVLIGGHPGAGKTTVLTRLIEACGARPVANDRAVLVPAADQRWKAIGVPLAWRFTPEGISGSLRLATALTEFEPARGRHLIDGKLELTPWEVSKLLGQPTQPMTTVDRIIILTRSPSAPTTEPDAGFIREHLDFGAEDFFAGDWLNLRPSLSRNTARATTYGDLWSRLAGTVPVLTLAWTDPSELPHVAAAVRQGMRR